MKTARLIFSLGLSAGFIAVALYNPHWGFLAWIGWVPLLSTLESPTLQKGTHAFAASFLTGLLLFAPLLQWIFTAFKNSPSQPPTRGAALIFLGAFVCYALPIGLWGTMRFFLRRKNAEIANWGSAAGFCILEYLRTQLFGGLPGGVLSNTQVFYPPLIQIAEWTGGSGITFTLMLGNGIALHWFRKKKILYASLLFVVATFLINGYLYFQIQKRLAAPVETLKVGILSTHIDFLKKHDPRTMEAQLQMYEALVQKAAQEHPDLILWPETALPRFFPDDATQWAHIQELIKRSQATHLIGAYRHEGQHFYNSAFLIFPNGNINGIYDKTILVPLAEYLPNWGLHRWFKVLNQWGSFESGQKTSVLLFQQWRIIPAICYEALFADQIRRGAALGGNLILNLSGDAWVNETSVPNQMFTTSLLRAVENRRTYIRVANQGISAIVSPDGKIIKQMLPREEVFVSKVPLLKEKTFYTRRGEWFILLAAAIFLVCVFKK